MVTYDWTQDPGVNRLRRSSEEFNFFQLVRLLEGQRAAKNQPIELKFSGTNSLAFKPNFVGGVEFYGAGDSLQATISTNGFHLLGQQGPVPNVYVEQIAALDSQGQSGAADYLDIFNDRIISTLYAIKKKFSPMLFSGEGEEKDLFVVFEALSGVLSDSAYESKLPQSFPRFWRKYAYLISNRRISYSTFKEVLSAEIKAQVEVSPASGGWRELEASSQAGLGGGTRLDSSKSLGRRFWSHANCLQLTFTFNTMKDYLDHLPGGKQYTDLVSLLAVLSDLFFDIELNYSLVTEQMPACELNGSLHLGQATWLGRKKSEKQAIEGARIQLSRQEMLLALQGTDA